MARSFISEICDKWGGDGVEFNFYRFVINIAPGFEGGDITVHTEPACTDDPRGNTCTGGESGKSSND